MFRPLRILAILVAIAGGLYVASQTEWGTRVTGDLSQDDNYAGGGYASAGADAAVANAVGYANHSHYEIEKLRRKDLNRYRYNEQLAKKLGGIKAESNSGPQLVGSHVDDLREVMRFDISPDWLMQRFSRVSTVLADLQLEGLRVPIVTGTRADDLAGTLTYYFDRTGQLQRVTLHGFTGDPNRLVGTMTQHYGMTREPALEAGVYTKRWNGQPVHFLRMTHAPVVYSDVIHQKYTVFLELNQPNLVHGISPEARRIVDSDRLSGRW